MGTRARSIGAILAMASLGGGYLACIDADGLDVGTRHADAGIVDAGSTFVPPDVDSAVAPPSDAGMVGCDSGPDATTADDRQNCGSCGNVCPTPSAALESVAACVGGKCTTTCAAGRADCNGVATDGCEVATATDGTNCGACRHDCGGGMCSNGACGSVSVATVGDAGTEIVKIAVDGTNVYFVTALPPSVWRVAKTGGAATVLASGTAIESLAVFGDTIYYSDNGAASINTVLTDGGVGAFTVPAAGIYGLAAAGTSLAGTALASGPMLAHVGLLSTKSFDTLYTQADTPYDLAANATTVYTLTQSWLAADPDAGIPTDGSVYRCAFPCTVPTVMATSQSRPFDVAVDATNVFWSTFGTREHDGTIASCPLAGCPVAGPRILASGLTTPEHLASDGTTVYWTDPTDGVVRSVAVASGTPKVLASGDHPSLLTIDDSYVYWSETGGRIVRVRR